MTENLERRGYLPSQEQLITASKVNLLCEASPETFDPVTRVPDAQYIVNALHLRIKTKGRLGGRFSRTSSSTSEVRAGATNVGSVSARFDQKTTKKVEFNVAEYRIGRYVAGKLEEKGKACIFFEPYWDRGFVNQAFGKAPEHTGIEYDPKSLEVEKIYRITPTRKRLSSFPVPITILIFSHKGEIILWQKGK